MEKRKEAFELVTEAQKSVDREVTRLLNLRTLADKHLYPILKILEAWDIPVNHVTWRTYGRNIELEDEARLTRPALAQILAHCRKSFNGNGKQPKKPMTELMGQNVFLTVYVNGITHLEDFEGYTPITIVNGKDTCKVKAIPKTEWIPEEVIPARFHEYTEYEIDSDCAAFKELRM